LLLNVEWGSEQERAYKEVRKILSSEPILKLPDVSCEIILSTDASNKSLGACMMQEYDGVKHPVTYASKKMLPREQNYSVGEREVLAIVWAVNKFHRYLYGQHSFWKVITGHWNIYRHHTPKILG